jgi:hypothetical protein
MFDSDNLENKAMTHKTIFVKNTGEATINGLPGGKSMPLKANVHGKPLDQRWRRLTRRRTDTAVLQVSDSDPTKVAPPAKKAKPAKAKTPAKAKETKSTKKGDSL